MYYIYFLKSINFPKSYVGITDNLERRLYEHNLGKHPYTKRYIPWKMIASEKVTNRIEARTREKYLKSAAGRKWMRYNIFQ
jgi:putative endonuclease